MDLGPFWVGDQPVSPIEIDIEDVDLTAYDTATAKFYSPRHATLATLASVPIVDGAAVFPWPDNPFNQAGLYQLQATLHSEGGGSLQLDPVNVVAQGDDGWHTLASARAEWQTALTDTQLFTLLSIAKQQCEEYAPTITGRPYFRHRQAQLMQARNILNSSRTDPSTANDGDLFVIRPYPLDNFIRELLRPRKARGLIGGTV